MMKDTIRIEKYLDGQMDADERQSFEKEISENPSLQEEVFLHKDMRLFLSKREKRQQLQEQLRQIGAEHFAQTFPQMEKGRIVTPVFRRYRIALAVAASFALLIAAYFLFRPSLYEQFATHPPLALVEKSAGRDQLLYEAENAFNNRLYGQAEELLLQLMQNHPDDDQIRIYLGIAKMETGKIQEARTLFESVKSQDPSLRDFARWNLTLSFLKTNEKERCRELARGFTTDSPYFKQAQKLLEKL